LEEGGAQLGDLITGSCHGLDGDPPNADTGQKNASHNFWLWAGNGRGFQSHSPVELSAILRAGAAEKAGFQWQNSACWMCERCVKLNAEIDHYQKLARMITDQRMLDGIAKVIEAANAEKAALHPEQEL
jgi:hypothetical protein